MVYKVNLDQCGLSLAKIKGTVLHTRGFKSTFHSSSDCLLQKGSMINLDKHIIDLTFRVSQVCWNQVTTPPLLTQHLSHWLDCKSPVSCYYYCYKNYKRYHHGIHVSRSMLWGKLIYTNISRQSQVPKLFSSPFPDLTVLQKGVYKSYRRLQQTQDRKMPWGELERNRWAMVQRWRRNKGNQLLFFARHYTRHFVSINSTNQLTNSFYYTKE